MKEALANAEQAKPQHRQPLDKLQGSPSAAVLNALAKRHDAISETVVTIHKQLHQLRADVEVLERTAPMPIVRRLQ